MNNQEYWEKRKVQNMWEYMQSAEDTADEIAKLYLRSSNYISSELDKIYQKFRKKHNLSEAEARRLLNGLTDKTSLDELKAALRTMEDGPAAAEILAELESPAYGARLERLQRMQQEIDTTMQTVYHQEMIKSTSHYVDLAGEAYYKSIFDIQRQTGLAFRFSAVDAKMIDQVVKSKWLGENYSARIWNNTQGLAQDLKQELLINLVTGRTDREAAEIIATKFGQGASNARRLVRTESCNLSNQMEMLSYEECGIETYIFVATLDLKTSSVCREKDGKRFPVAEQQPGENCPPMHPWCRSTTICDISDEELAQMKRRARNPETGKNETVPANTTYEQWYKEKVEGQPDVELKEKMTQNHSADSRQLERYKEILGKDAPKDLESFQKTKYTDSEKWKYTELDYSRRNNLKKHPEKALPGGGKVMLPDEKFTNYLFGGNNADGLPKGNNFEQRLGYSLKNWEDLQGEIKKRAPMYPALLKGNSGFGDKYEQQMIIYGLKGTPANVIVGWIHRPDGTISMTSTYIKEVSK